MASEERLSTKAAAEHLGVTTRTLYWFIDQGNLPAYEFGRVVRLKAVDAEAFIETIRAQPATLSCLYPPGDN